MADVDRVEQAAMRLEVMPEGLVPKDQIRFIGLRYLYGAYKRQIITREQASAEKKAMLAEISRSIGNLDFERKCWEASAERYKLTELAKTNYRLNRTLENADALVCVLDGLKGLDET